MRLYLPSSDYIFISIVVLLLMSKLVMWSDIVFSDTRSMPNIGWTPSSHVELGGYFGVLLIIDSLEIDHAVSPGGSCVILQPLFLKVSVCPLVLFIYHFLDLATWVHYVLILLLWSLESLSMSMPSVVVLNCCLFLL